MIAGCANPFAGLKGMKIKSPSEAAHRPASATAPIPETALQNAFAEAMDSGKLGVDALSDICRRVLEAIWKTAADSHGAGDSALASLIELTTESVRRIHSFGKNRIKVKAAHMKEFPIIVSARLEARDRILGDLQRIELGSALPNVTPKARWTNDDFTQGAELILAELKKQGFDVLGLALRDWAILRTHLREDVLWRFLDDPKNAELCSRLKDQIKGRRTEGAIADRVRERLLDRVHSLLGLKGRHGVKR